MNFQELNLNSEYRSWCDDITKDFSIPYLNEQVFSIVYDGIDIVMFLYRDEYYNRDDKINDNLAELIIAKNRNGPTASMRLQS